MSTVRCHATIRVSTYITETFDVPTGLSAIQAREKIMEMYKAGDGNFHDSHVKLDLLTVTPGDPTDDS